MKKTGSILGRPNFGESQEASRTRSDRRLELPRCDTELRFNAVYVAKTPKRRNAPFSKAKECRAVPRDAPPGSRDTKELGLVVA